MRPDPTRINPELARALLHHNAEFRAHLVAEEARRSGSRSFAAFVKQAWGIVDQAPLVWNWYLQGLADHLDAVARGRIKRLVGNGPPRNGKSNLFAIMWPAWVWTWAPSTKFIYLSYSDDLVVEHSVKCRALIESPWYQDTYRPRWQLGHLARSQVRDNQPWRFAHGNRQDDFVNTAGGRRIASSVRAGVTGRGADIVAVDDPLSAEEATGISACERATRVIKQAMATRFNDPKAGRGAILMQRVSPFDPSKWAIDSGFEHFCTPMEFDPMRRATTFHRVRIPANGAPEHEERREFWRDPRVEAGELLSPERFPPDVLRQVKLDFGAVSYAAQFQQQPVSHAMAGAYFKRAWFKILDEKPKDISASVRRWDLASTEGGGDWTVGVKLSRLKSGMFVVEDVVRVQQSPRNVRETVRNTAKLDTVSCAIVIPQDPGQAGKDQAEEYANMLAGYTIRTPRETGDKVTRSGPASSQCEAGNVSLVLAPWNEAFVQALEAFPDPAVHDDDVDAFAGAVSALALGDIPRQVRYMEAMKAVAEGRVKLGEQA